MSLIQNSEDAKRRNPTHFPITYQTSVATLYSPYTTTTFNQATMSANFENTTPLKVAEQAERDLNSDAAKKGHGSDSGMYISIDFKSLSQSPLQSPEAPPYHPHLS
jgi:hypothetical protein